MDGTESTAAAWSAEIAGREGREEVAPLAGCRCPRGPPEVSKEKENKHRFQVCVQNV